MEATTVASPPSFETVWASLQELSASQKETDRLIRELREERREAQKEADRQMQKLREEQEKTDRQMKETDRQMKETDRQIKRTGKQIGGLHRRFGELAEHLVAPGIHARFNEMGYFFGEVAPGGLKIIENGKTKTEIDLLFQNDDTVMAVEVKVRPAVKDVEHHIKRLEILRDWRRKKNDLRKIQGAIAGAVYGSVEKTAVIEAGLYVIEQSGDTMKIDVPDDFVPRDF